MIAGATVIDGRGGPPLLDASIVVVDGRIVRVGTGRFEAPAGAATIDGRGKTIIPGLIDGHVHVATPTSEDWREQSEAMLGTLLAGGVTTVRDMAGDAREVAALARAVDEGRLTGPRIYFSAIMAGPAFFDDPRAQASSRGVEIGEAPWARSIDAGSDFAEVVASAAGTGATGLKTYAALGPDPIRALATEARRQGMKVWAHATVFPARPSEIVEAGADMLSHAPYLVWEGSPASDDFTRRASGDFDGVPPDGPAISRLLDLMVERGTMLDPTLFLFDRLRSRGDAGPARFEWARRVVREAHARGVRLVAGTDLRAVPGEPLPLHAELETLVEHAGLTPMEALTTATVNAAESLGVEADYGSLEVGKVADLVVLEADPLDDIRNVERVWAVFKAGRRVDR